MLLRYVAGRAGSGKSTWVYHEIKRSMEKNALPVYLVVPEQFTLQAEKELIASLGAKGLMQARVASPSKLASDVFAQVAQDRKTVIDECGLAMALRAATVEIAGQLKAYKSVLGYAGFSLEMVRLISELRKFDVSPGMLLEKSSSVRGSLKAKAEDIAVIYEKYNQYLESRSFTDSDSRFNSFIDNIAKAPFFTGCDFYFDGFDYLPPQHCRMIAQLLAVGSSVTVTQDFDTADSGDSSLFLSARSNIARLNAAAAEAGAPVQWLHLLADDRANAMPPDISHLECNLFAHPPQSKPRSGDVTLCRAIDVEDEVEAAAAWILEKAHKGSLHWREFAVQCADHDGYSPVISRIFEKYGIPVFIDKRREIIRHPAIRFIINMIKLIEREYRMDDVLRLAKTGCLKLPPRSIDLLEIYLTAFAPRGAKAWAKEWTKGQDLYNLPLLNECRKEVYSLATTILRQSGGRKATGRQWAKAIYTVLEERKFDEYLDGQALSLKSAGLIEEGAVTERVWNAIMEVLDQLSEIIDGQLLDAKELSDIVQSGFASMEVGIIPTGVDQVQAGSLGRSKFSGIQHMLILGAYEGMLTGTTAQGGILTDKDMDILINLGVQTGRGSDVKDSQRRFLLYQAITKGSASLYISWPLNGPGGEAKQDAQLVKIIELLQLKPEDILDAATLTGGAYCAAAGFGKLPVLLRRCAEGAEPTERQMALLKWYTADPVYGKRLGELAVEIAGRELPSYMPAASYVLGGVTTVTASQLETYNDCPFRHFVDYVLRPGQWRQHGIESADAGKFMHEAMELFGGRLSHLKYDLQDGMAIAIMEEEAARLTQEFAYGVLQSDARLRWTGTNLKRTCLLAAQTYAAQMSRGAFRPVGQEVRFGKGGMPAAPIPLPGGGFAFLEGRIDRLDVYKTETDDLLRVIDYKSSSRPIDVAEAINGLSVQTWLYAYALGAVWRKYRQRPGKAVGAYIFPLIDPWVEQSADEEKNRRAKLRLNGWCVKDEEIIFAMDSHSEGGKSDLFNFNLPRGTGVLEEDTSRAVIRLVAEQSADAVVELKRGCIAARPWRSGKENACQSCSYGALCRFQVADLKRYRQLLDKEEINLLVEKAKGEQGHAMD